MQHIDLFLDAKPVPWTRPTPVPGRRGLMLTDPAYRDWKRALGWLIKAEMVKKNIAVARDVSAVCVSVTTTTRATTKAMRKRLEDATLIGARPLVPNLCVPDADNILKGVLDAAKGIAYHDDRQVWACSSQKTWSDKDRIHISITWEEPQ